jgi:hypothetical protein
MRESATPATNARRSPPEAIRRTQCCAELPRWVSHRLPRLTRIPRIAILDTGYDGRCPNLTVELSQTIVDPDGNLLESWEPDGADTIGHGSECTSIVHALLPEARVVVLRVFGRSLGPAHLSVMRGLTQAAALKVDVALLCASTTDETVLPGLYAACTVAQRAGCIVVAAGDRADGRNLPASFAPVIGVGASSFGGVLDFEYLPSAALEVQAHGRVNAYFASHRVAPTACSPSYAAASIAALIARMRACRPRIDLNEVRGMLKVFSTRPNAEPNWRSPDRSKATRSERGIELNSGADQNHATTLSEETDEQDQP